jgi:outer membrane protein TolC
LATAEINLKRDAIELQSTQQTVLVDVRNAWQTIAAQRKALEAAIVSRQIPRRCWATTGQDIA